MSNKIILFISFALLSSVALANSTVWTAGSNYKGTVIVPIENGPRVLWKCNGAVCTLTGPYGQDLSLSSCQYLVSKIGVVSFYGNSEQKLWDKKHPMLSECNRAAR